MENKEHTRLTDQVLIEKVLRGDTKAFRSIVKNTEGLVAQIIFKMIANREDRKDIAQDVYVKAFHKLDSFKFQAKLSTWIGQIAYNTCINYLEKKKLVLHDTFSDEAETEDGFALPVTNVNPFTNEVETDLLKKELTQILGIEIDKLSPLYKTLITLYHTEELSYAEIGQIIQLPEGTVKSYLFRARKALNNQVLLAYNNGIL